MNLNHKRSEAFILLESLVVIAVMAILAALILSALGPVKKRAQLSTCINNLRQINLGIRMYADDSNDASPPPAAAAASTNLISLYSGYKALVINYVRANNASSSTNKLFLCPADQFCPNWVFETNASPPGHYVQKSVHDASFLDYSSYVFNGGDNNARTNKSKTIIIRRPGLTGIKLTAVQHPSRTALVSEGSAPCPWSWHDTSRLTQFNDARNVVSFVDGHVSYTKIYWNSTFNGGRSGAYMYDPPASYDYQWSPN